MFVIVVHVKSTDNGGGLVREKVYGAGGGSSFFCC